MRGLAARYVLEEPASTTLRPAGREPHALAQNLRVQTLIEAVRELRRGMQSDSPEKTLEVDLSQHS